MPAADLRIHGNQLGQTTKVDSISIRNDVLYTNYKGEENARIRKRSEKILQKLHPALQRMLLPDETVFYVARARSPLTVMERLTAAWWTAALAASAIVITNKRILFFPVKRDGSWRESVRAAHWGDLKEVKPKGLLIRNVTFQFNSGTNVTYTNFNRADAKKIAVIAAVLVPAAAGELTSTQGLVQLCPDCRNALTQGQYSCPGCGLIFKNEKSMVTRSVLLPGGGYFYTGHPLIAILPAVVEGFLVLEVLLLLVVGLASPKAMHNVSSALLVLGFFWALETAVTILHCRRYVRDFIPEKRDPSRAPQGLLVTIDR
jgi:PH (Pleckstrin Homology) domain-containing protein